MMRISKTYSFEASHILPNHPGKCGTLHGHSYGVEVAVEGVVLKDDGFVVDYWDLDAVVKPVVDRLDHKHLNCFIRYPSAENIAAYIAHEIRPQLLGYRKIDSLTVQISETSKTTALWSSEDERDTLRLDPEFAAATAGRRYQSMQDADYEGWKAPDVSVVVDAVARAREMERHRELAKTLLEEYTQHMAVVEQLRLFETSLVRGAGEQGV